MKKSNQSTINPQIFVDFCESKMFEEAVLKAMDKNNKKFRNKLKKHLNGSQSKMESNLNKLFHYENQRHANLKAYLDKCIQKMKQSISDNENKLHEFEAIMHPEERKLTRHASLF